MLLRDFRLPQGLVGQRIAGDHAGAVPGERRRHPALAGADAADQADDQRLFGHGGSYESGLGPISPLGPLTSASLPRPASSAPPPGPPCSGTRRPSAFSSGVVISSRTTRPARAARPAAPRRPARRGSATASATASLRASAGDGRCSIASLMRSAAEPWISMLIASRSAGCAADTSNAARIAASNAPAPAQDRRDVARPAALLQQAGLILQHLRIAREVGVDERLASSRGMSQPLPPGRGRSCRRSRRS